MRGAVFVAFALALAAGCSHADAGAGGTVRVNWTSSDTTIEPGHWTGRGEALWCASEKRLVLLALARDTGVGLILRADRLEPGSFPIEGASGAPPNASLALRFPGSTAMEGYVARLGRLELTGTERVMKGRFTAEMTQNAGQRNLALTGEFSRVPILEDTACAVPRQTDSVSVP